MKNEAKTPNVTWRLTKEEFLRKVDEFISTEFVKVKHNIGKYCGDNRKYLYKILTDIKFAENDQSESKIRKLKLEAICSNTDDWYNFSTTYHNSDDVIFRILLNRVFSVDSICLSYLCGVRNQLTEDLIEDILFINSDLFDFTYWNDYHVSLVNSILAKGNNYGCTKDLQKIEMDMEASPEFKKNIHRLFTDVVTEKKITDTETKIKLLEDMIDSTQKELSIFKRFDIKDNKDVDYYLSTIKDIISLIKKENPDYNKKFWKDIMVAALTFNSSSRKRYKEEMREFILYDIEKSLIDKISNLRGNLDSFNNVLNITTRKLQKLLKHNANNFTLKENLDWFNIDRYQNISNSFKDKYKRLFQNYCAICAES